MKWGLGFSHNFQATYGVFGSRGLDFITSNILTGRSVGQFIWILFLSFDCPSRKKEV